MVEDANKFHHMNNNIMHRSVTTVMVKQSDISTFVKKFLFFFNSTMGTRVSSNRNY